MSRAVKWILGIVSGLVALCALAVVGFFIFSRFAINRVFTVQRSFPGFEGRGVAPMAPFQGMPGQGYPFRHFGGFSPFGFFGGWLIVPAAIGLFALAVIALILVLRRPNRAAMVSGGPAAPYPPAAPGGPGTANQAAVITGGPGGPEQAAIDQPAAAEAAPEASAAAGNCPSCGRAVQADWSHCPYCGTGLTGAS